MAVFERLKELGVLKAIGMQPVKVFQLMLTEAGIQAVCAIGLGVVLSIPGLILLTTQGIDVGALGGAAIAGMTMDTVWYAAVTPLTFQPGRSEFSWFSSSWPCSTRESRRRESARSMPCGISRAASKAGRG